MPLDTLQGSGELYSKELPILDFPGGPVPRTPHSQCRGRGFDPVWGLDPIRHNNRSCVPQLSPGAAKGINKQKQILKKELSNPKCQQR